MSEQDSTDWEALARIVADHPAYDVYFREPFAEDFHRLDPNIPKDMQGLVAVAKDLIGAYERRRRHEEIRARSRTEFDRLALSAQKAADAMTAFVAALTAAAADAAEPDANEDRGGR